MEVRRLAPGVTFMRRIPATSPSSTLSSVSRCRPKPRRAVAFHPQVSDGLEERVMLSAEAHQPVADSAIPGLGSEVRNIVYTTLDHHTERLDVYLPDGTPPAGGWPVLLAIHGGGWRKFSKDEYGPRIAGTFVAHGYAVIAPNYILSTPTRSTWPLNLEDVQSAIRWIRDQSDALNVNPDQIAAIGESAGANLSELAGTDPGPNVPGTVSDHVEAVVAFSAPSDLAEVFDQSNLAKIPVRQFLGGTPTQVPQKYAEASPIDHVSSSSPPMFLVHGLEDPLIPVDQARQMAAALTAAGVRNELTLVNGGHALAFPDHYSYLVPRVLEFLSATWNNS
jgi:acetyl esterase/lipase